MIIGGIIMILSCVRMIMIIHDKGRGCKSKECTTLLVPEALRSEAWWTLRPLGGGPEGPKGGRIVVVVD